MSGDLPRLAVIVGTKGRGTNMANLLLACKSGDVPAAPALVVSPAEGSPALLRAASLGVPTIAIPAEDMLRPGPLLAALQVHKIDWICLAGYLFLLPEDVVQAYDKRILNIHPSLLPKFGGKGMYGIHVHRAVLAAGETVSGCSVHLVTQRYDEGPVIAQESCRVFPDDTPESLAERVLDLEHTLFPRALKEQLERSQ